MPKPTKRRASPRGSKGERRGGAAPKGPPPLATEWRDERDLYVREDGSIDEAAKRRLREWRQKGLTWTRRGSDGRIQVACDPTQPDRPWRISDSAMSTSTGGIDDAMQRHIELETRLRRGPYLGDGHWDDPQVRFTLSRVEFRELRDLRRVHGCGEEWGAGDVRQYWRPDCDDNVVGLARKILPLMSILGRALR